MTLLIYSDRNGTRTKRLKKRNENGTIMERLDKKEREGNDLAEGSHSRTEWNDLKKFGTCLSLGTVQRRCGVPSLPPLRLELVLYLINN